MRTTRPWLFAFLPLLYLAVVLALVAVQFSKKNASFTQSLGDMTIAGKSAAAGEPAEITLKGRGLVFLFDAAHYLQADARDGTTARLRPLSWSWKDGNAVVSFQQDLQLVFEKVVGGDALLIHPAANEGSKKFTTLRIPFAPRSGARVNRNDRGSFVEIITENSRLLASVDGAQDHIDTDSFVLTAGSSGFRPARIDPLGGLSPDLAWVTVDNKADPSAAETALNQYWDRAYKGWLSATFSSRLADAWAREALARGDYAAVFDRIDALRRSDDSEWTFDAAPYLGNVVELTIQKRRDIEAASSRSQPDWAGQGRLWYSARLYGPEGSADRVKGLLLQGKIPDDAPALVAMLQNLMTVQAVQPSDLVAARIQDIQHAVLSKVVRREGELFVQPSPDLLDIRSGLILGRLWLDAAHNINNQSYGSAGAQLVASALAFQDTGGRLPETLVVQNGQIIRQEGTLRPEDIYASVKPAQPQETELPAWGPGAFVRAPAKITSQAVAASAARFTFRFPTGSAEHIVISGVPAFDHITMHGIRWRSDPSFQSYTDGWVYSASTKTLYVKIKHRDDLEELVIHFTAEE